MLDESIYSSPQKTSRSIHKVRLRRKTKRKLLEESHLSDSVLEMEQGNLQNLYDSDDPGDATKQTIKDLQRYDKNYNPFEYEQLLVAADRSFCTQRRNNNNDKNRRVLPVGFQKCEILKGNNCINLKDSSEEMLHPISETELLQCCKEAEMAAGSEHETTQYFTPPTETSKIKTIAESIIEDFCGSLTPEFVEQPLAPEDCTPIFNFRNRPLRTYSRRSLQSKLEEFSVTEPLIKNENKAEKILLSLSCTKFQTSEEIYETPVTKTKEQVHIPVIFPLHDSCDTVAQSKKNKICSPLLCLDTYRCDENTTNSMDLTNFSETATISLNLRCRSISLEEDFHGFAHDSDADENSTEQLQNKFEEQRSDTSSVKVQSCDIVLNSKNTQCLQEPDIFSECSDDWNVDCDFFANYRTQEVLSSKTPKTDINNHIEDVLNITHESPKQQQTNSNDLLPSFVGFKTASNKNINISKEAQERATKILQELPDFPVPSELEIPEILVKVTVPKFDGLQTESTDKPKISEPRVLEQLPDLKEKCSIGNINNMDTFSAAKETSHSIETANSIAGDVDFANIQLSEWFLEENVEFDNIIKPEQKIVKTNDLTKIDEPQQFVGFSTASAKTIRISDEARQRAERILADLPELPMKEKKTIRDLKMEHTETASKIENCPVEFQEMQLSEWPLSDEPENLLDTTNKRKRQIEENNDSNDAEITLQEYTRPLSKSITTSCMTRTPLNQIDNGSLKLCATELPITKNNTKPNIISRRNLLSLRGKRKHQEKQNNKDNLHKNDEINTETPIKQQNNSNKTQSLKTAAHTPETPNLAKFCDAVPNSSTPAGQILKRFKSESCVNSPKDLMDADFKQIKWETSCDDKNRTKTPGTPRLCSSKIYDANVSFLATKPSPKQRIERLRMYGKPPTVSPILMNSTNNVRAPGLRRANKSAGKSNINK